MCSYFIILNLLLPLGKEKTCKQIIKRQHDYCYNRDINKMLEKLRKWSHSFCLEGLRKGFLKQIVAELYLKEMGTPDNKNERSIERLCDFGVTKNLSVPRACSICSFEISLDRGK